MKCEKICDLGGEYVFLKKGKDLVFWVFKFIYFKYGIFIFAVGLGIGRRVYVC